MSDHKVDLSDSVRGKLDEMAEQLKEKTKSGGVPLATVVGLAVTVLVAGVGWSINWANGQGNRTTTLETRLASLEEAKINSAKADVDAAHERAAIKADVKELREQQVQARLAISNLGVLLDERLPRRAR